MTDWMIASDLVEPDAPTRERSTMFLPAFDQEDARVVQMEDRRWLAYVARLAPTDLDAAFLLPDEAPDRQSTPQQIRNAIRLATRRALGSRSLHIQDYELGRIQGEMRVLLPQGSELRYYFNDELGWKATVVIGTGADEYAFLAYYRETCMNPARYVAAVGGELDTSRVVFMPLDEEAVERLAASPELDRMTFRALRRLGRQYLALSRRDG